MINTTCSRILWCGLLAVVVVGMACYWVYTTRPDTLLRQARTALEKGDAVAAGRIAERLNQRGYDQHAYILRGEIWVRLGRSLLQPEADSAAPTPADVGAQNAFGQALRELSQVADDGSLGSDAVVLAAECLVRLGDRYLAAEGLNTVVRRSPDHKEAHRWLAAIYIDTHSPWQAVHHLRE
ncbi:MAG: hypothetical protein L0Z62_32585, partial [Gemmataceae bacterium]|nr:hypothetical protein [Gemmataceae bacterium]